MVAGIPSQEVFEMITTELTRVSVIAMVALLLPASAAAAEPTLSDVAGCNKQASERTGASALPRPPGAPGPDIAARPPDGSQEPRELPAHGGVPVGGGKTSGPKTPATKPGEKTDPSGALITQTPDPLLKGMDATKADDPAYREAYRDCMRARTTR
jgi:hypothetical protein